MSRKFKGLDASHPPAAGMVGVTGGGRHVRVPFPTDAPDTCHQGGEFPSAAWANGAGELELYTYIAARQPGVYTLPSSAVVHPRTSAPPLDRRIFAEG